jgi:hypothetical protein
MTQDERTVLRALGLFLLALFSLVYCDGSLFPRLSEPAAAKSGVKSGDRSRTAKEQASSPAPAPQVHYGTDGLPPPVEEMREAILSAVRSGRIEDLRHAWELNELKPDLGVASSDPIAHWKQISGDGEGREILAALAQILDAGYVVLPLGADLENNRLYVWPYFAEVPLTGLSPAQEVELMRLLGAAAAREFKAQGRYSWWRIAIGADGVWHSFRKMP